MARSSYGRPRGRTWRSVLGTTALVIFLMGLFIVSVYWFRQKGGKSSVEPETLAPANQPYIPEALDLESTEATLRDVSGGASSGQAKRETLEGRYRHTVKATLAPIDRENFFYEGWLLRPVPFDYFSTGEMVTNFLGEFVLDWNSSTSSWQAGPSTNYWAYTRVIITLEAKDGNPDPDRHILEGEFGN